MRRLLTLMVLTLGLASSAMAQAVPENAIYYHLYDRTQYYKVSGDGSARAYIGIFPHNSTPPSALDSYPGGRQMSFAEGVADIPGDGAFGNLDADVALYGLKAAGWWSPRPAALSTSSSMPPSSAFRTMGRTISP